MWRVFAILLEYCCKSNYQMMISKLNEEHRDAIDNIEKVPGLTDAERELIYQKNAEAFIGG
jgi:predicted DNA binding CopG/RHH family protein